MRNTLTLAALALALTAGIASATVASPGQSQIASYLGVDAGAYSNAELAALLAARHDGDQSTYAFLLAHGNRSASETVNIGKAQLAAQVGLDPAQYTSAELIRVQKAQIRGDLQTVNFVVSHANRNGFNFPQAELGSDN